MDLHGVIHESEMSPLSQVATVHFSLGHLKVGGMFSARIFSIGTIVCGIVTTSSDENINMDSSRRDVFFRTSGTPNNAPSVQQIVLIGNLASSS